jgi:hypothetical protein
MIVKKIGLVTLISIVLFSCKESEVLQFEDAKEYLPMVVGKSITYKLDSTNYIGYTVNPTISSYYVKDSVEAKITDNLGRPSFRVVRYLTKLLTNPTWTPISTMMVTVLDKSIEVNENNLRYIKLQNPVKQDFSWKGNSWEYQYNAIKDSKTYNTLTFPETVTVNQADATDGIPTDPNGYSERNYSIEVYAKTVGLVYKEFLHWSYQPPSGTTPGYRSGYGIKLSVVAKN